ncbi:MAG: NosD domain-containing protein, partial [Thermoplasmata archaeon]
MKFKWIYYVITILIIPPLFSFSGGTPNCHTHEILERHPPIIIEGDDNFTLSNGVREGNGTPENPYIISNWEIEINSSEYGIYIWNTTKHFLINNCSIIGLNKTKNYGICLTCVKNGIISGNEIKNTMIGLGLDTADSITITKNNISFCDTGIGISTDFSCSSNTTISGNKLFNNSIGVRGALDGRIVSNLFTTNIFGLFFEGGGATIEDNLLENNTVGIICKGQGLISHNEIKENKEVGLQFEWYLPVVCKGNKISQNPIGVCITFSPFISLPGEIEFKENIVASNMLGVVSRGTGGAEHRVLPSAHLLKLKITDSKIIQNEKYGLVFDGTGINTPATIFITKNEIDGNGRGILFVNLTEDEVYCFGNIIKDSISWGVEMRNCLISGICASNLFISNNNNSSQSYHEAATSFYWNLTSEGNYWSDWQS